MSKTRKKNGMKYVIFLFYINKPVLDSWWEDLQPRNRGLCHLVGESGEPQGGVGELSQ